MRNEVNSVKDGETREAAATRGGGSNAADITLYINIIISIYKMTTTLEIPYRIYSAEREHVHGTIQIHLVNEIHGKMNRFHEEPNDRQRRNRLIRHHTDWRGFLVEKYVCV